jgi:hypothetical protein
MEVCSTAYCEYCTMQLLHTQSTASLQYAVLCSMQYADWSMQTSVCRLQYADCSMQYLQYLQYAVSAVQDFSGDRRRRVLEALEFQGLTAWCTTQIVLRGLEQY